MVANPVLDIGASLPIEGNGKDRSLRIAIIGAGVSKIATAWFLQHRHDVTLLDREEHLVTSNARAQARVKACSCCSFATRNVRIFPCTPLCILPRNRWHRNAKLAPFADASQACGRATQLLFRFSIVGTTIAFSLNPAERSAVSYGTSEQARSSGSDWVELFP